MQWQIVVVDPADKVSAELSPLFQAMLLVRVAMIVILLALTAVPSHASGITYTYDALGRVITLTYDNGTQITYAYDAAGNRTSQVVGGTRVVVVNLGGMFWVIPVP